MDTANGQQPVSSSSLHWCPAGAWHGAPAIVAEHMSRGPGADAGVSQISVCVGQSEFFGLMGPAGAGKTTLMRLFAAIVRPQAGRLSILGHDSRLHGRRIRRDIGYVGHIPGLDEQLTGRENVYFSARLHGVGRHEAIRETSSVLARLDLSSVAESAVKQYPPATRKRLAVACGIVHQPRLLLLDSAVDGMPAGEYALVLSLLDELNRDRGMAVILSSVRLDGAEQLCKRVAILDCGRLVTMGTPAELKAHMSGVTITVHLRRAGDSGTALVLLGGLEGANGVWTTGEYVGFESAGAAVVPTIVRLLEEFEIGIQGVTLSKPSLAEVFFQRTGRKLGEGEEHPVHDVFAPERR